MMARWPIKVVYCGHKEDITLGDSECEAATESREVLYPIQGHDIAHGGRLFNVVAVYVCVPLPGREGRG